MQIKVANEVKQDAVISGQDAIKNKIINGSRIKSIQRGSIAEGWSETLPSNQKSAGYEHLQANINPVNAAKSILMYNIGSIKNTERSRVCSVYALTASGGKVGDQYEKFGLQLKNDGVYSTPVSQTHTNEYIKRYQAAIAWQVVEFY